MREQINRSVSFLRATAIGGLFFLLPLAVLLALLGRVYAVVSAIATPLQKWVPVNSPLGITFLFCLAVAILVLVCFFAGILASRAIGRKFSSTLEKNLIMVFPKYAIYKDLLAGNLSAGSEGPSLKTILLTCPEGERLAFEAERLLDGSVVVYLPGAPDAWIGSILIVPADRVASTQLPFNEAVGILERLGRDSRRQFDLLAGKSLTTETSLINDR